MLHAAQYWNTQYLIFSLFWVLLIRFHLHCGTSGLIWCFCKVNEKICPVPPVFQDGKISVSVLIITHSLALCVDVDFRGFHSSWPAIDRLSLITVQQRDGNGRWRRTENTLRVAVIQPELSLSHKPTLIHYFTLLVFHICSINHFLSLLLSFLFFSFEKSICATRQFNSMNVVVYWFKNWYITLSIVPLFVSQSKAFTIVTLIMMLSMNLIYSVILQLFFFS